MQSMHGLCLLILLACMQWCAIQNVAAQQITLLDSNQKISLRGLSVVNDEVFWVSGSKGSFAHSTNGGKKIDWGQVAGYAQRDFRDIEAFDAQTAIIMAIDSPAVILKTQDGGNSWRKVFEDNRAGMFLDAMHFKNKKSGVVVGDPIHGRFFLAQTNNGGESWSATDQAASPISDSGEALFAASGTNIVWKGQHIFFVSGGNSTHFIDGVSKHKLPMIQGKSSAGANSIDISEDDKIIIVGGDFLADSISHGNCVITDDKGKTFYLPKVSPYGYKSSILYIGNQKWLTCGTSGVDISVDDGITWRNISRQSFHVIKKAKYGKKIYLAGKNGRIAEVLFH
jgi:photosystem II stability/assembly factor-like uncharacterized protein